MTYEEAVLRWAMKRAGVRVGVHEFDLEQVKADFDFENGVESCDTCGPEPPIGTARVYAPRRDGGPAFDQRLEFPPEKFTDIIRELVGLADTQTASSTKGTDGTQE